MLIDATAPPRDPSGLDSVVGALADPTRRSILRLVRDHDAAAGEIAERFPAISRPAVSQHLRVLHDAGLVSVRADGRRRIYRSRPEGFHELADYVGQFWSTRLDALRHAAESAARDLATPGPAGDERP